MSSSRLGPLLVRGWPWPSLPHSGDAGRSGLQTLLQSSPWGAFKTLGAQAAHSVPVKSDCPGAGAGVSV